MSARFDSAGIREADRRARSLAQTEFDRPLVLEAGAGTGKTAVLVGRIVSWCVGPGWEGAAALESARDEIAARVLRGVVAITFTEAASAEMADRVRQALSDLASGETPVGMVSEAIGAASGSRARQLLPSLELLSVGTIHAFCHRLLADAPLQAGLHPRFEVDADGRHTREVLREVIESGLARGLGEPPDPDWQRIAAAGVGPPELEEALVPLLDAPEAQRLFSGAGETFGDPRAFAAETAEACAAVLRSGGSLGKGVSRLALDAVADTARHLRETPEDLGPARECWADNLENRLRDWARGRFGKGDADALGDAGPALAESARLLAPKIRGLRRYRAEQFAGLRRVLGELWREAGARLGQRGVVSFDGLLSRTSALLADHPRILQGWRDRTQQILVDEFQDTDPVQCDILRRLTLGDAPGPGLFVVGDPKQSIYGFRAADLRAYESFVDDVVGASGHRLALSVNFRSRPEILSEVERVIAPVMEEEPGRQPPFATLLPGREETDPAAESSQAGPAVAYWVGWDWKGGEVASPGRAEEGAALEARALVRDLLRASRSGVPWKEMALLFRSIRDIDSTLSALRDADIPYRLDRDAVGEPRRELLDAVALLRCVFDPGDVLALTTLLRSAWVGLPDRALQGLRESGFFEEVSRFAERDEAGRNAWLAERIEGCEEFDPPLRASLALSLRALAAARASAAEMAPEAWIDHLRELFAIDASEAIRRQGRHRLENLDALWARFARSALTSSASVLSSIDELERSLAYGEEESFERFRATAGDAVTVSTIHAAKGLDWDHVYLLRLERRPPRTPPQTRLPRVGEVPGVRLLGVANLEDESLNAKRLRDEEAEQLRLIYVAMTRAKRRLVISGVWPLPGRRGEASNGSPLARIADQAFASSDALAEAMAAQVAAGQADYRESPERHFVFPTLLPEKAESLETADARVPEVWPDSESLRKAEAARRARRQWAQRHQARPLQGIASEHADLSESSADSGARVPAPGGLGRRAALALGEAVHAALEELDPEAEAEALDSELCRRGGEVLTEKLGAEASAVQEELETLLKNFLAGPLYENFAALHPRIVARELPILAQPPLAEGEAVASIAGSIDLLYRDPDGSYVVADYKTDRIAAGDEASSAAHYRRQGDIYRRAVQRALGLSDPPRFELWWLRSQRVTRVDFPERDDVVDADESSARDGLPDGGQLELF